MSLALLLMLHTRNNTAGNKLVIFSSIALYYGDNYIISLICVCSKPECGFILEVVISQYYLINKGLIVLLLVSILSPINTFSEVSTRMVSEYKTKLQITDAENTRLEGMVSFQPPSLSP